MGKMWRAMQSQMRKQGWIIAGKEKLVNSLWLAAVLENDEVAVAQLADLYADEGKQVAVAKIVVKTRVQLHTHARLLPTLRRDMQRQGILETI